jgi:membrane protease YdiL (CAAX protease family)
MTENPLIVSLVVLMVLLAISVGGGIWQASGRESLQESISKHLIYGLVVASLFLLAVVAYTGWWREVGLRADGATSDFKVLIAPALAVVVVWIIAFKRGLPEFSTLRVVVANTMFVGFSEELMFRGIFFYGVENSFGHVWAVVITAVVFGSTHAQNGFITGQWPQALEQAFLATLWGFWTGAVRLSLGTLFPLMIIHWLWDLGLFSMTSSKAERAEKGRANKLLLQVPLVLAMVLFVYGLFLLYTYTKGH